MSTAPTTSGHIEQRRILVTEIPGPRSQLIHKRKLSAVSAGVGTALPVYVDRVGGGILVDVDGNHLIDLGSGIAVTTVGNSAPRVVSAVQSQVEDFTHTCFMITPYEEYVAVCERLNVLTPGDGEKRSALFNSGSEAVENAIKIARVFTGRTAVIAFDHAYHGRTNLTMALTAKNMPYKQGFGPFAGEIYRAPMAYPYRWPTGADRCADEAFDAFVSQVHTQVGEQNTAAVIIEPIQGEGGFIVPPPGYLKRVADWCTQHGILFIADEIQSGFCRTGDWFAVDHEGVVPDLVTTAKGLAGGMPLAAVTGRAELMNAVHEGGLGGTYGGNPVAAVAALATIKTMRDRNLVARARELGDVILKALRTLQQDVAIIGDVRGRGAMIAFELVQPGTKNPNAAAAKAIVSYCNQQGVIALACGTYGNVIRLLPPLAITDEQLADGLSVMASAVRSAG